MQAIELPAINAGKTRNRIVRIIALMFAILIGSTALVRAGDDVATGQSVIRSQEAAIARDDAAAAYGFASPAIHSMFRTPDTFMAHGPQRLCARLPAPQLRIRRMAHV